MIETAETTRYLAPAPEVQYLPQIFRRIKIGELRIPAFQREFKWKNEQALSLLESVYRGFPIGSMLFWKVEEPVLKVESSPQSPFPIVEDKFPLFYVLDGLQRLAVLYGVFHCAQKEMPGHFNVLFDLRDEEFRHVDQDGIPAHCIHLTDLFSPKEFLTAQSELAKQNESDFLLQKAIELHSAFQEYLVPMVTISGRSVSDIVEMFRRINSTGTSLGTVDFVRAVTWSEAFDLNREIAKLLDENDKIARFGLSNETLVKMLAVLVGKEPTGDSMLELRSLAPSQLLNGMKQIAEIVPIVIDFLSQRFCITHASFVPYEGQLVVACSFYDSLNKPSSDQSKALERWFWAIGFNEQLRGKPDHFVSGILARVKTFAAGNSTALTERLKLSSSDLIERRLIANKALTNTLASLFAVNSARSLITGRPIDPDVYMATFDSDDYAGILKTSELSSVLNKKIVSEKIMANSVLVPKQDRIPGETITPDWLLQKVKELKDDADAVCASQLIPASALDALRKQDWKSFLRLRANHIEMLARQKVEAN